MDGSGLLLGVGAVVAIIVLLFVWFLIKSAYYWIGEKITGRDLEGEALDREIERSRTQAERDAAYSKNNGRKRTGAGLAAMAIAIVAFQVGGWWLAVVVYILAVIGLHMAAGVAFSWTGD